MFAATFPAPPRRYVSSSTSTTGTGASGEIRRTFPQMNSSSMTSPTVRITLPEKPFRICSTRARFICTFVGAVYDRPPSLNCDILGGHRPPLQSPQQLLYRLVDL